MSQPPAQYTYSPFLLIRNVMRMLASSSTNNRRDPISAMLAILLKFRFAGKDTYRTYHRNNTELVWKRKRDSHNSPEILRV